MKSKIENAPEISIETGSFESLVRAVEAGADAVIIGLKGASPHSSDYELSIYEYSKAFEISKSKGVKLCLSLDWVYKDSDIKSLTKALESIKPHFPERAIVGDLGVAHLIRQNYPIAVCAGSLLSVHNIASALFLKSQGFSRGRLNPFLTKFECEKITQKINWEFSLQVHGELCFSFREFCYASSFFTARSALRQACKRVCRRPYMAEGKLGYWLSARDLELIEHIEWLKKLNIREFFIRGFSKPAEYAHRTVMAYRIVRDAKEATAKQTIEEAKKLLAFDFGRSKTCVFFENSEDKKVLDPQRPPIEGLLLGKIESIKDGIAVIKTEHKIDESERIKLIGQAFEEGPSFTAHVLSVKRINDFNYVISLKVPKTARIGDFVFKISPSIDTTPKMSDKIIPDKIDSPSRDKDWEKSASEKLKKIYAAIERSSLRKIGDKKPFFRIELWGKLRPQINIPPNTELVIDFREKVESLDETTKEKVVLSLPPVISENERLNFQRRVEELLKKGFKRWQLGHFSQLEMFDKQMRTRDELQLTCGSMCNVFNLICANVLYAQGVCFINLPLEADYELIEKFSNKRWSKRFGITIYGSPPLMTSRIKAFESSEPFLLFGRDWTLKIFPKKFTVVRAREPFCAPPILLRNKLRNFAFWQIQVDSTNLAHSNEIYQIFRLLKKGKTPSNTRTFNMGMNIKI